MFRFLRRENLVKQSQQSVSCPAINSPQKDGATPSESSSDSDGEIAEVSRKQRMFARKSIRRDRKKQKEQQKKIENNMISMDDFLSKQAEFKLWLKEEKQKMAADLKSPKLKSYFKDFVKIWNKKKLPQKYYRGSSGTDTPPPSRNQRFSFVEGSSPFPDLSGFPQPIDLSLEGVLLDSPFSTFGKCPGDPLTPHSTPRIIKLPPMKEPDHADKENSNDAGNFYVKNIKEPSSEKKKKKNKNTTPKKSKMMKNDNPYKVTVLSWTSKGELSVHPASPSSVGKPSTPSRSKPLNTSIPYHEVKDSLEISDYDPLYADPDPLFNANTSVSRSKSLDSGLQLDSHRPVVGEGCKSVEELYAVPVKKKRMSVEKGENTPVEEMTSPPPPLPPKRKSPLEAWPYQSVQMDGISAAPVFSVKKDDDSDEFPSPPPPGQGFKVFAESVLSPAKTASPMRMAVSMPDLCDSNKNETSSSSSDSSSTSENESEEETFEVKVKVLDPEVQQFLDGDFSAPPPPPDVVAEFYPPIRLSLLPPPPPELLMDTPPDEDESRFHSEAYTSHSSLIAEQGTPRSSKMLDEDTGIDMINHWASKCNTPKYLCVNNDVAETPPPTLVPITPSTLQAVEETIESFETEQAKVQQTAPHSPRQKLPVHAAVSHVKETSLNSRRISEGPLLVPPPLQGLSKKSNPSQSQSSSESDSSSDHRPKSSGETPNHDYLEDAQTDLDTSTEKDEVFSYRKALSGAMHNLKSAYASSMEDITADVPKRHKRDIVRTSEASHLYVEDVIDQRSTPKHDSRNRHHSENSAVQLQKYIAKRKESSGGNSSSNSMHSIPEIENTSEEKKLKKKPPVVKPKPSKNKVTEAMEKAQQRQSSSDRSNISSTSSDSRSSCSGTSVSDGENSVQHSSAPTKSVQRVLGQLSQNCVKNVNRPSTPPRKPPRTPSSASKTERGREHNCGTPLTPTRQKVKGILKTTPMSGVQGHPRASPHKERKSSCSKTFIEKVLPSSRSTSLSGVFETDIDSVLEDNSENRDPNSIARCVRETDLDKILEEMQSSYLLSPLTSVDASSEVKL